MSSEQQQFIERSAAVAPSVLVLCNNP